ncbi:(Fe-S)-binding protein [Methanobacterium alcaliphilum]|uniref:(Fe-S)-binding protein n=1 Tax=Methanobacterium alcaliphilum TaxID=392018 RepID=UPI00200A3848|nr:heterodisulfide reductase-related iron-sulfur binding cluster [Methanobacterium alcaliphilum]MCK9152414.1 heterodisulfide reductase-related iron-sulfur binding cluster [Methanobacterium alcaliphilum]
MIYFKGCVAREKEKSISEATESILNKAEVDYSILNDEICCGSVLLRTGSIEEAYSQIKKNLKKIEGHKILVSCAGCYKTLTQDYNEITGAKLDVIHTSQLFRDLIDSDKLKIKKSGLKITYHDPCHLGRHCNEYDSPRDVLNSFSNLIEMEHNKEYSKCCGAGGGVKSAYPDLANTISNERMKEAEKADVSILVTSCPFCKLNLEFTNKLDVYDLSEFILQFLED